MGQLSLFTEQDVAGMRSPRRDAGRDEFRRAHARHRDWGKAVRHAEAVYRQFHSDPDPGPPPTPEEEQARLGS